MEKKEKNNELNFLYLDEKYTNKTKKNKKKNKRAEKKSALKKEISSKNNKNDEIFNFDKEIVIGVTKVPQDKKNNNEKKSNKNKTKDEKKIEDNKKRQTEQRIKNNKKNNQEKRKLNLMGQVLKWTVLLTALVAAIIFFMMSPLFDVIEISVVNNEKISSDTIISLSNIQLGENIYRYSNKMLEKNIKQNAYIDSVKIRRKLPNKIEISVKERKTTFLVEYGNSYAYINNQGYILEISEEKLDLPIITGITTTNEQIAVGNRLNEEDLKGLEVVLKIMESASSNSVNAYITKINIKDKQNYTLILEGKKKTVYLGDGTNLSNRMLYLKVIIEKEEGIEGEIFLNGDLNKDSVFFREKI